MEKSSLKSGSYFHMLPHMKVHEIIDTAGGVHAIAEASLNSAKPITFEAVHKWRRNGIPDEHWSLLIDLAGVTVDEIYAANMSLKAPIGSTRKASESNGHAA